MELFLENHWQYMKNLVTILIYMQSCTFRHFTKNCTLKNMSEQTFRHILLRKTSPKRYFKQMQKAHKMNKLQGSLRLLLGLTSSSLKLHSHFSHHFT